MRAAIYARYSTDRQSESSIDDQVRVCQHRADSQKLTITAVHGDNHISGSTPVSARPGGRAMLAEAMAGSWSTLIIEGLDRLSRDMIESERIVRQLEQADIRIIGVSDGYDSRSGARKMHRGMRAIINEQYLDDLRHKTHRGLDGKMERGYSAGGKSFGYTTAADLAPDGRLLGQKVAIDEAQASVVREIFARCAAGESARAIVADLNARKIASPRGGTWAVSGVYGTPTRGLGILNNELYTGRVIWNRLEWIKDWETGKRTWRRRPESEWRIQERPDLRIIDAVTWAAVRARMGKPRRMGGTRGAGASPKTLFGGLLRCGHCGGAVVAVSAHQYGCAARKDRGLSVCAGVAVARTDVDVQLNGRIRALLANSAAIAEFERAVRIELAEQRRDRDAGSRLARTRAAELDSQIDRLTDAIAQIGISPTLVTKLRQAELERRSLALETGPAIDEATLIRQLVADYREKILDLRQALEQPETRERARVLLLAIVGPVTLTRVNGEVWAETRTVSEGEQVAGSDLTLIRVAGAGFGNYRWRVR